jgi:hypothetical protein
MTKYQEPNRRRFTMRRLTRILAIASVLPSLLALVGCGGFGFRADSSGIPLGGRTSDDTILQYEAETPVEIWKNGNDGGIEGGNGKQPKVTQSQDYYVADVYTYHWNDGKG